MYLHTELVDAHKPSHFKHFRNVLEHLEVELMERGVTELYTTAKDLSNFNFCIAMGFRSNLEVILDKYEIMVKDLD